MLTRVQKQRLREWCDLLESGEFTQMRQQLTDGREYCCLGVGCELYSARVGGFFESDGGGRYTFIADFGRGMYDAISNASYMPDPVMKWFGLTRDDMKALSILNDDKKWSFKEIATYIRNYTKNN